MNEALKQISEAFEDYDDELLLEAIKEALDNGADPIELVRHLSRIIEGIGQKFSVGELFLPDMVLAGDLMEECMAELKPVIAARQENLPTAAKVVLGTVKGDIHDIGKNMVKTMLSVSGFEVIDLGTDVSAEKFFEAVMDEKPDILALSSCMTTTVPSMQDTIDLLKSRNLDKKHRIVVGGGSMSPMLAERFGNCTYGGRDAFEAVSVLRTILSEKEA